MQHGSGQIYLHGIQSSTTFRFHMYGAGVSICLLQLIFCVCVCACVCVCVCACICVHVCFCNKQLDCNLSNSNWLHTHTHTFPRSLLVTNHLKLFKTVAPSKSTHSWWPKLSTIKRGPHMDGWLFCARLCTHPEIALESNSVHTLQSPSGETINRGPPCVYTCKKITYVKDPVVHVKSWIVEMPK